MDIKVWLKMRKDEIFLVRKYFPPILKDSFISSISWWTGALGLTFLATLIALGITYKRQGEIEISNFFPPNFEWGVLIGLALIFLYQTIVETTRCIDKYRIGTDKFTWNDVSITIPKLSQDDPVIVGLEVRNNKPYNIQRAIVKIVSIQKDRFVSNLNYKLPLNLYWMLGNGEGTWGGRKLHKNGDEPRFLCIAGRVVENANAMLMTGDAEPNSKGGSEFIEIESGSNYKITLQWFGEVDGHTLDEYRISYFLKFEDEKLHLKEAK